MIIALDKAKQRKLREICIHFVYTHKLKAYVPRAEVSYILYTKADYIPCQGKAEETKG
jgi:hypothetical protein